MQHLLALLLALAVPVILWIGRDLTFLRDQWDVVLSPSGWSTKTILGPFGEHLSAVPILVDKTLFVTVGLDHYWVFRLVGLLVHLACVALFFAVVRQRRDATTALLVTLPVVFFGSAWEIVLWPVISFSGSVLGGLATLLLLPRRTLRAGAACVALLAFSLASSSFGLCILAGVAVEILWQRDRRSRLWIVALPSVLYIAWFLAYNRHPAHQGALEYGRVPSYVFRTIAGTVGGYVGLPLSRDLTGDSYHYLLVAALSATTAALLCALAWKMFKRRSISGRQAMLLVTLSTYWVSLAVARSFIDAPFTSRYLYPATFFLILFIIESVAPGRGFHGRSLAALAAAATVACVLNLIWLVHAGDQRRRWSRTVVAEVSALEMMRGSVKPTFAPDRARAENLVAGPYFAAIDRYGSSPAESARNVVDEPEYARNAADQTLIRAGAIRVRSRDRRTVHAGAAGSVPVTIDRSAGAAISRRGRCIAVRPLSQARATVEAAIRAPVVWLGSSVSSRPLDISMRRFASTFTPLQRTSAVETSLRDVTHAGGDVAWHIRVASLSSFTIC
jgi:hypothetical protein